MPDAISFEAKFYALRKSKDGLIVSFVIHPNDAPNELITAPIGEQYIVALAPYVEKPDVVLRTYPNEGVREINEGFLSESRSAEQTQGDITQPAGRVLSQKERYAGLSAGQQAVARAGMLCKDRAFQEWVANLCVWDVCEENAEEYIRRQCCQGGSRGKIAVDDQCLSHFLALETEYLMATGKMASPS